MFAVQLLSQYTCSLEKKENCSGQEKSKIIHFFLKLCKNLDSQSYFICSKQLQKLKELELLNPKPKKESEIISVWKNMTVKELAASAGRPIDEILDALFFVDNQNVYDAKSIFGDLPMLHETAKKLGAKVRIIARPGEKETADDDEGCDAVKPYYFFLIVVAL